MPAIDRVRIARETYSGYESGKPRDVGEAPVPGVQVLQRRRRRNRLSTYWTRCWPNAEMIAEFDFKRIIDRGE
jgi:hypothetical protein